MILPTSNQCVTLFAHLTKPPLLVLLSPIPSLHPYMYMCRYTCSCINLLFLSSPCPLSAYSCQTIDVLY